MPPALPLEHPLRKLAWPLLASSQHPQALSELKLAESKTRPVPFPSPSVLILQWGWAELGLALLVCDHEQAGLNVLGQKY